LVSVPLKRSGARAFQPERVDLAFELRDEPVELIDDRADGFRLAEIDPLPAAAASSDDRCRRT
jgi:hypothetical protein